MKKILLPILGAFALILGACSNPGPDPVPPGTTYEVIFKNYDGTTLYTTEVEHGANAIYEGQTPSKPSDDDRIRHNWTGWDKTLYEIEKDTTITATFSTSYLMRFYKTAISEDFDPEVDTAPTLEEEDLLYEGWMLESDTLRDIDELIPEVETLMLPINDAYGYAWDSFVYLDEDNEVTTPSNSETISRISYQDFYSVYNERETQLDDVVYVVSFYNADEENTRLYVDGLREGETYAVYGGETPTLPDNVEENISYTFKGWYVDGDETETLIDLATYKIEDDVDLIASYTTSEIGGGETPTTYTVTFANYDDTVLFVDTVEEGGTAVYEGETPTRPDDSEYTYTFNGWDKDITNVQEFFTTKATYVSSPIEIPPTPQEGYNLVVGTTSHPFTLNENNEIPNCEEYMISTGIALEVDDTFTIKNNDNEIVLVTSYRDQDAVEDAESAYYVGDLSHDNAGTSIVHVAGSYTFYLKFWDDGAIELYSPRVSEPEPPTPTTEGMYIVGDGSFVEEGLDPWTVESGIELQANTAASETYVAEYMITDLTLAADDEFRFYDATNETYITVGGYNDSATAGSAFSVGDMLKPGTGANETEDNILVVTPGKYSIYLHNYVDNPSWYEVWITPITTPEPPTPTTEGMYIVGDGSFVEEGLDPWTVESGIKLQANPNAATNYVFEYMITGLTLEAGDQFRFYDVTQENYVNVSAYSNGSAFSTGDLLAPGAAGNESKDNILVVTPGEYDIYIHNYTDNPNWIEVYATPITEPAPTPTVEDGAYVVGSGSFLTDPTLTWNAAGGVKMETNPNPSGDIATEYTITIDFEVGDTWKLVTVTEGTTNWHAWQNGGTPGVFAENMMHVTEDSDKNVVVDQAGTYTIYLSFYADGDYSTWVQVATPTPVE